MLDAFRDAFRLPDLKRKILFTMGVLFLFRLGTHIPTPGIDAKAMASLFEQGGVLGFLDLFAGGALRRFSVFALGVAPYINASIVMQLLVVVFPALEKLQKEGEQGRKKIVQYTRLGTVFFAAVQAIGMTFWLRNLGVFSGGWMGFTAAVFTVTAGSLIVMWLGEEISDHGIGNGISLLIFAGIVARLPEAIIRTWTLLRMGEMNILVVTLAIVLMLVVIAGCVLLQEGQRRLPVQYAKRVVGNKVYGGQSTFIPLKVNQAGVIPIIFASSVLLFPYTIVRFFTGNVSMMIQRFLSPDSLVYMTLYVLLIIFFLLLYGRCFRSQRHGKQHEEVWRVRSRYQAGQTDCGVHREDHVEDHPRWRGLPCRRGTFADADDPAHGDNHLLLWRDSSPDRSRRRPRHGSPDRGTAPDETL